MNNEHKEPDLKFCPCCGSGAVERIRDNSVFSGQVYADRYPEPVASQRFGYQVRCTNCGLQTCWWHYQHEADEAWSRRPNAKVSGGGAFPPSA